MEEAFEKMKKDGKTDVESLVKWLKDSKVIGDAAAAEEKARALFKDCADKKAVTLEKFKEAVATLAAEQKKNVADLAKTLAEQGPKLLTALQAGASAFTDAMKK